jgi:adenine-specific DNA-methyltransferase
MARRRKDTSTNGTDANIEPQLRWHGKARRSRKVAVVPLHVQEEIEPEPLLLALQCPVAGAASRITSHEHASAWRNRLILGDSLRVMTTMAERESLQAGVQMIFTDPPYGIGFGCNWQVGTRHGHARSRQSERIKAFRDTWKMGVHSYLTYLRERLIVARQLLANTGSIFVQIGDENVHRVRCLLDEVFGSRHFIATIAFRKKKMPLGETYLFTTVDYLLWYGKDRTQTKFRKLFVPRNDGLDGDYGHVEVPGHGTLSRTAAARLGELPRGARLFQSMDLRSSGRTESCVFPFEFSGRTFFPSEGRSWKTNRAGMEKLRLADRLFCAGDTLRYKLYFDDYPVQELSNVWMDTQGATGKRYIVQTPEIVVQRCLLMTTDPGDLVLDPTCGSGTTACVAEQWGRRWITIDTSRLAVALARTRLMTTRFPCYQRIDVDDLRQGFVCKRVPHVTLGSITHNADLQPGLNRVEIERAITQHAAFETLHDQPQVDRKRVRVGGPFTVESQSPHRARAVQAGAQCDFTEMVLANLRAAGVQNTVRHERLTFECLDTFPNEFLHAAGNCAANGTEQRVAVCIGPKHGTVGREMICRAQTEARAAGPFDLLVVCGFAFDPYLDRSILQQGEPKAVLARINPELAMEDALLTPTDKGNLFTVFGEPVIRIERQRDRRLVVRLQGVELFDPTTGAIRERSTDDIACWFLDTAYDGLRFVVRHAYFCGADRPYDKLQRGLAAAFDADAWASVHATQSRPFAPPATGEIAVKVVNHYGDEVVQVFNVGAKVSEVSLKRR